MFILSLEDDLVKNLDADWLRTTVSNAKLEKNPAASRPLFKKILDKAQSKAEDRYFQIRKQLLRFDNVMNEQRRIIYGLRLDFMRASDLSEIVSGLCGEFIDDLVRDHLPDGLTAGLWDTDGIAKACRESLALDLPFTAWANEDGVDAAEIRSRIFDAANAAIRRKAEIFGPELMRNLEKQVLLETIDSNWREHRIHLDELRSMIGFRAYARRDPLSEFQTEALEQFEKFLAAVRRDISSGIAQIQPMSQDEQLSMMGQFAIQKSRSAE